VAFVVRLPAIFIVFFGGQAILSMLAMKKNAFAAFAADRLGRREPERHARPFTLGSAESLAARPGLGAAEALVTSIGQTGLRARGRHSLD
jgi:hypothetical protein